MVSFECDYIAGAHPQILKRLAETNMEALPGYGMDRYTESAKEKIIRLPTAIHTFDGKNLNAENRTFTTNRQVRNHRAPPTNRLRVVPRAIIFSRPGRSAVRHSPVRSATITVSTQKTSHGTSIFFAARMIPEKNGTATCSASVHPARKKNRGTWNI